MPTTVTRKVRLRPDAVISNNQTWTLVGAGTFLDAVKDDIDEAGGNCDTTKYAYLDPIPTIFVELGLEEVASKLGVVPAGALITAVNVSIRLKSDPFSVFLVRSVVVTSDNFTPNPATVDQGSPSGVCQLWAQNNDSTQPLWTLTTLSGFTNPALILDLRTSPDPQTGRFNWYGTRVEITYQYQTYEIDSHAQKLASPTSEATD